MRRTVAHRAALFFAPALLAALLSGPASAQSNKPWQHALIQPKSDAGILLMPQHGGFFKKLGLDINITNVKDDQIMLHALIAGDLDSFEGGPGAAIIAAAHGADVKVTGCSWLMVPHGLFVHDDITAMDQLKGKTIAISSPAAFPDLFARGALDHFGVPEDGVKFASLGGDLDRYKALVAHLVEAAVVSGEYTPIAEKEHIKMLVSAKDAMPHFVRMCEYMMGSTIKARPDDAAKFLAGEILGLRYAVANKDAVVRATQEITGVKPDDPRAAYMYDLAMEQHSIGTEVPIPTDDLQWMNELLVKVGNIAKPLDMTKVIDPKPREGALKLVAQTQ
ncbi:MAG TPA: ABC transporter substrate-binding protein [Xanthobacteraceae bacterium]|jgi:NitT/TauT family transport system substrate-binding protein|nr:ABC transporter substrate-binding protein [Xanthobacteraceae bacterium]